MEKKVNLGLVKARNVKAKKRILARTYNREYTVFFTIWKDEEAKESSSQHINLIKARKEGMQCMRNGNFIRLENQKGTILTL
jgi:hypothetical protein